MQTAEAEKQIAALKAELEEKEADIERLEEIARQRTEQVESRATELAELQVRHYHGQLSYGL